MKLRSRPKTSTSEIEGGKKDDRRRRRRKASRTLKSEVSSLLQPWWGTVLSTTLALDCSYRVTILSGGFHLPEVWFNYTWNPKSHPQNRPSYIIMPIVHCYHFNKHKTTTPLSQPLSMFSYFAALMGGRRKGLRNGGKIYFHAKKVHLKGEEAPRKPCHSFKAQWTKGKFEFGECRGTVL